MKNQTYSEQYNSPKWQKKRLEILNLHGFKCDECDNKEEKQLHVHHRFYIKGRKVWEYDNDVFQVLCETHHKKIHNKNKQNCKAFNYVDNDRLLYILERCEQFNEKDFLHKLCKVFFNGEKSIRKLMSFIKKENEIKLKAF